MADHIMGFESLLCIAIRSELVHQNVFVILVMAFHCQFKTVNETLDASKRQSRKLHFPEAAVRGCQLRVEQRPLPCATD